MIGAMMFCLCNNSNSSLSLSQYMKGIERGVLMQNGFASFVNEMWNSSPIMVLTCPSKILGNSFLTLSSVSGSGVGRLLEGLVICLMLCWVGVIGLGNS